MTRWRVVCDPRGTYAVLSDRAPGPVMGARGGLHGWAETREPIAWLTFEQSCLAAAAGNGKDSVANMDRSDTA